MMDRRTELDQRRMDADEAHHQAVQELNAGGDQDPKAWEDLDRKHSEMMEQIDAEYQALDQEQNEYWIDRERGDIENQRIEFEAEQERRRQEEGEQ